MRKQISLLLGGMAVCLAAAVAVAQHSGPFEMGGHGFGDPERMVEHMARRLQLDDSQAQALNNIVTAAMPEITELRDAAHANREAIAALDLDDPDYAARLDNLAAENGRLAAAATRLHGRLRSEISAALTPEQRAELRQRMSDVREHFARRGHRHQKEEQEL